MEKDQVVVFKLLAKVQLVGQKVLCKQLEDRWPQDGKWDGCPGASRYQLAGITWKARIFVPNDIERLARQFGHSFARHWLPTRSWTVSTSRS